MSIKKLAIERALKDAAEEKLKAEKLAAERPEMNNDDFAVRHIQISNKRCFYITRIRIYAHTDLNNPVLDKRSGWSGNYNQGDQNKDMQRELNWDLGQNIIIGRILFDHYGNGHQGRFYGGSIVLLKDINQNPVPTQFLDGQKKLSNMGYTDLRYNLIIKPVDYSQTINDIENEKKKKLQEVEDMQKKTKEKTDKAIADSEKKIKDMEKASETRVKNSKIESEKRTDENRKKNKCKATNQLYSVQMKTMQIYCSNMGNTPETMDARCQNLTQKKDSECFGNIRNFYNVYQYKKIVNFLVGVMIFILILKWLESANKSILIVKR